MRNVLSGIATLCLMLVSYSVSFGQNADAITGIWYTEDDKSLVEVWKYNGLYYGKIIWVRDSLDEKGKIKLDKNNPKEALRSKSVIGLQMLNNLKYENGEWRDGKIYDPESGNEYSCKASLNGSNLDLRGYILGMPFLGRTTKWRKK